MLKCTGTRILFELQKYFFFTAYPEHCVSYYGIHSVECLNKIWKEEGCIEDSDIYPQKLDPPALANISDLTIGSGKLEFCMNFTDLLFARDFQSTVSEYSSSALAGHAENQVKCWGIGKCKLVL